MPFIISEIALKSHLHYESNKENSDAVIIREGKNAADRIYQYVDWLLSTCNPDPPDENVWRRPSVHPCQVQYEDIDCTTNDNDYVNLLNSVKRHTRCSANYCLRSKANETELKCRFNFPVENRDKTTLLFEPIHTKDNTKKYKLTVATKRNDPRLNKRQRLQLRWRVNCDIQPVIDYHACVEYLAKYAAKNELRSNLLKYVFKDIFCNVSLETLEYVCHV